MKEKRPYCKTHTKTPMKLGKALTNGVSTTGDGTMYPDHTSVKMVDCWKCPRCGYSITVQPPSPPIKYNESSPEMREAYFKWCDDENFHDHHLMSFVAGWNAAKSALTNNIK